MSTIILKGLFLGIRQKILFFGNIQPGLSSFRGREEQDIGRKDRVIESFRPQSGWLAPDESVSFQIKPQSFCGNP
jgi:hypothetical protein